VILSPALSAERDSVLPPLFLLRPSTKVRKIHQIRIFAYMTDTDIADILLTNMNFCYHIDFFEVFSYYYFFLILPYIALVLIPFDLVRLLRVAKDQ